MPVLDLSIDALLTTTRSVRKRLDLSRPVEPEVIRECLELALQAPTGGNSQAEFLSRLYTTLKAIGG